MGFNCQKGGFMSDQKAAIEELINQLRRGLLACGHAMSSLSSANFTVGEVALGCLWMIDFMHQNHPGLIPTAEKMMAIYHGENNKIDHENIADNIE
jgi:hypothetical protein